MYMYCRVREEDEGPSTPKKKQKKSGTKQDAKEEEKDSSQEEAKEGRKSPEARVVRSLKSWLGME
jgi:hypothetical protein